MSALQTAVGARGARPIVGVSLLVLASVPVVIVIRRPGLGISEASAVILSVIGLVVAASACIAFMSRSERPVIGIRMGPLWIVYFTLTFGLTSLAWIHPQGGSSSIISGHTVPTAILGAIAAMLAVGCGYVVGPGKFAQRITARATARALPPGEWRMRSPSMPLMLYGIGVASRIYAIRAGTYGYFANVAVQVTSASPWAQPASLLQRFALYGIVLAALDAAAITRSTQAKYTFRSLLVIELAFGLYSGVKGELILTLLGVAVAYSVGGRRIRKSTVAIGIVAFLLLVPLNTAYRQSIRPVSSSGQTIGARASLRALPRLAAPTYGTINIAKTLSTSAGYGASRLREIDNLALILQKTPHPIPFEGNRKLVISPIIDLVPRALWPGKPVLASGYVFSQQYYNLGPGLYTSSAVTEPGDLYRYGGWPDVLVGMALLGALIRLFEDSTLPIADVRRVLLYVPLFIALTGIENDVATQLVSLVQTCVVLFIVCRVAFVSEPSVDGGS